MSRTGSGVLCSLMPELRSRTITNPMKRLVIMAACVLALAIAGSTFFFSGRRYDYTITQSRIDGALQERFPVSRTYYLIFKATYSNPKVRLLPETNRIEVGLDAEMEIKLPAKSVKLGSRASPPPASPTTMTRTNSSCRTRRSRNSRSRESPRTGSMRPGIWRG